MTVISAIRRSSTEPPAKQSRRRPDWLVLTPLVVAFVYSALLTYKPTRAFALQMADENYPVELLTFAFLMLAGFYGLWLAFKARRRGLATHWFAFYLLFSVVLLLTGMEEISWGQWFFHFQTPESIARINTQGEFTLHNLKGLGGHTVWLRLAFGVGALVGTALWPLPAFRPVAVSPKLLAWWLVITAFALGDLVSDFAGPRQLAALFDVMSEVVELLIAVAACLYLWLNANDLLGPDTTRQ
jgi:hypothetical protein